MNGEGAFPVGRSYSESSRWRRFIRDEKAEATDDAVFYMN